MSCIFTKFYLSASNDTVTNKWSNAPVEAERPTLAATTHKESVRQVTARHRLSMQVTGSTRRETSQGKAPKPQSLSPKVRFSSTNYS